MDQEAKLFRLNPGATKNGDGREVPYDFSDTLRSIVEEQWTEAKRISHDTEVMPEWVFFSPTGGRIRDFRGAWKRACRRAGIEGAWFHDLRRSAVRRFERAGLSRITATALTGHKTEAVYRRYAISDRTALAEGLKKIERFVRHSTDTPSAFRADDAGVFGGS